MCVCDSCGARVGFSYPDISGIVSMDMDVTASMDMPSRISIHIHIYIHVYRSCLNPSQ